MAYLSNNPVENTAIDVKTFIRAFEEYNIVAINKYATIINNVNGKANNALPSIFITTY